MSYANYRQIPTLVQQRDDFVGNTMHGHKVSPEDVYALTPGLLAGDDFDRFYEDRRRRAITYVVYSFDTPIAWETNDGAVYMVRDKFSVTTSKHQGRLYLFESR